MCGSGLNLSRLLLDYGGRDDVEKRRALRGNRGGNRCRLSYLQLYCLVVYRRSSRSSQHSFSRRDCGLRWGIGKCRRSSTSGTDQLPSVLFLFFFSRLLLLLFVPSNGLDPPTHPLGFYALKISRMMIIYKLRLAWKWNRREWPCPDISSTAKSLALSPCPYIHVA